MCFSSAWWCVDRYYSSKRDLGKCFSPLGRSVRLSEQKVVCFKNSSYHLARVSNCDAPLSLGRVDAEDLVSKRSPAGLQLSISFEDISWLSLKVHTSSSINQIDRTRLRISTLLIASLAQVGCYRLGMEGAPNARLYKPLFTTQPLVCTRDLNFDTHFEQHSTGSGLQWVLI